MGLAENLRAPDVVILRGPRVAALPWQRALAGRYAPSRLSLFVDPSLTGIPVALDKPLASAVNAWVCRGVNCLRPIGDLPELLHELEAG
jgi:hypothetical protein